MSKQILCVTVPVLLSVIIAGTPLAWAGDIDPPPGPIEPTGRFGPRTEISDTKTPGDADSLFKISEPGSYYLAGNITGVSGKSGIEIAADDVTLDLNGFALIGVPGSNDGIPIAIGVKNLAVRNGTIRDWGGEGIGALDPANLPPHPTNGIFEDLRVSGNGNHGFSLGPNSRVINCGSFDNGGGGDGFGVGSGSVVVNCTASGNDTNGFISEENCVFVNCTSVDNGPSSYADGFQVKPGCILTGCAARGNGGHGILEPGAESYVSITGCTLTSNALFGIRASDSLIRGNTVKNNAGGECDTPGSTLIHNHGCADTAN